MSLRTNMMTLAQELWTEGTEYASRKSYAQSSVAKDAANRIQAALGLPLFGDEAQQEAEQEA